MTRLIHHIRLTREHYGNVLHVWCRLVDLGINRNRARTIAIVLCHKI